MRSFADPVFVLCNGRSGSTLLRFLLDAHPDLACPPETNLPGLCVQLATVWSLIEGAPLSATRGDEPPDIPEAAIAGVRETMDRMVGSYLGRRGRKRYCDKSLGTARYAELLLRVYPEARFICLYRHPMDVIASGVEACPWGPSGYGFEPYVAASPGNTVMALASFWADNARATLGAEERFADKCFRLRYEDLVADPETISAALFEFLGVPPALGISELCFSAERERFGAADYKIWYTSRISADSVGRGWSVPTGMIAPELLNLINDLAGKIGYLNVDEDWGTTAPPADLRLSSETPAENHIVPAGLAEGAALTAGDAPAAPGAVQTVDASGGTAAGYVPAAATTRLGERLGTGLATWPAERSMDHWQPHAGETFVLVALTKGLEHPAEYWRVDLGSATVTLATQEAQETSDWDVIGSAQTWERVIGGEVNMSVAMRACHLRYCDNGESAPLATETRLGLVAHLLGLASWQ